MATSTENFKFKKPDDSDFYDVQDQNGNWDIADQELEKLNNPTFEDYTGDTSVPAASTAIEELKSKSKLGVLLSNIKAAFKGACLIGHIVNNCVTDRSDLPLSAAQGKALMEAITVLNTKTKMSSGYYPGGTYSDVNFTYRKTLGTAEISVKGLKNMNMNGDYSLITLPEEYRPSAEKTWDISAPDNGYAPIRFTLEVNGLFRCHTYATLGNLANVNCTLTYII